MSSYDEKCKPWEIEAIVVGDGSKGAGANGKTLIAGCVYASAKMTGGHENYHAIDPETIKLSLRGEVGFSFHTRALDTTRQNYPKMGQVTAEKLDYDVEQEWKENLVDAILCFCLRNKGVAMLLGGPGLRGAETSLSRRHCEKDVKMLARRGQLMYAPAVLVNAVGCLRGAETGMRVLEQLSTIDMQCTKLGKLGPVTHKLGEADYCLVVT